MSFWKEVINLSKSLLFHLYTCLAEVDVSGNLHSHCPLFFPKRSLIFIQISTYPLEEVLEPELMLAFLVTLTAGAV